MAMYCTCIKQSLCCRDRTDHILDFKNDIDLHQKSMSGCQDVVSFLLFQVH